MGSPRYRSSRPDSWSTPPPYCDPATRRAKYGPIRPLPENETIFKRMLRWTKLLRYP